LRKDCRIDFGLSEEEVDQYPGSKDLNYIEESSEEQGSLGGGETVGMDEPQVDATNTLIGKIKIYCPSLFFKLSLWERDFLENYVLLHTVSSVVNKKGMESTDLGVALGIPDQTLPLPTSVSVVSRLQLLWNHHLWI
jgi:hypothetical protein